MLKGDSPFDYSIMRAVALLTYLVVLSRVEVKNINTLNFQSWLTLMLSSVLVFETVLVSQPFVGAISYGIVNIVCIIFTRFTLMDSTKKFCLMFTILVYQCIRFHVHETMNGREGISKMEIGYGALILLFYYNNFIIEDDYSNFILSQCQNALHTQKQWLRCLQKIPNGVILYNLKQAEIVFEN